MRAPFFRSLWNGLVLFTAASAAPAESAPAFIPKYVSRTWRTQDCLPESRIRALAQTPDGYLWIGTSGGLARFDGVRFVVYSRFSTPTMTDDNIRALSIGRNGSLWIATDGGGLLQYQGNRFRSFGPREGLANEFVGAVLEDRKGQVWAGTNRGLYVRRAGRFERVDEAAHLTKYRVLRLVRAARWHHPGRGTCGLFSVDSTGLHRFGPVSLTENQYYLIRETSDGALWLGTNHGLRTIRSTEPDLKRPQTRVIAGALAEDHSRNVWLGTVGGGLLLVRDGKETAFQAPPLPNDSVSAWSANSGLRPSG